MRYHHQLLNQFVFKVKLIKNLPGIIFIFKKPFPLEKWRWSLHVGRTMSHPNYTQISLSVSFINKYLIKWNRRSANWMTCIEHEKENIRFGIVPLMLAAGYPKALTSFHVPNNTTCMCVSPLSFHMESLLYQHGQSAPDTSWILFLLASTLSASCGLAMNHPIHVSVLSL